MSSGPRALLSFSLSMSFRTSCIRKDIVSLLLQAWRVQAELKPRGTRAKAVNQQEAPPDDCKRNQLQFILLDTEPGYYTKLGIPKLQDQIFGRETEGCTFGRESQKSLQCTHSAILLRAKTSLQYVIYLQYLCMNIYIHSLDAKGFLHEQNHFHTCKVGSPIPANSTFQLQPPIQQFWKVPQPLGTVQE